MSAEEQTFKPSSTARNVCLVLVVIGLVCFGIGLSNEDTVAAAWSHWLLATFLTTIVSLFGLFFIAMNNACTGAWSVVIRRVLEAMTAGLWVGLIGMLVLMAGLISMDDHDHPVKNLDKIYEWMHVDDHEGEAEGHDEEHGAHGHGDEHHDAGHALHVKLIKHKTAFLNKEFFIGRIFAYFAIWLFFAYIMIRNSRKQDIDGDVKHTTTNLRLSCLFLVLFCLTVSLAAFDWIMSLDTTWFSTMFGAYQFAALFNGGTAAAIVLLVLIQKMGYLKEVNKEHYHNLGIWLIVTCTFWAYLWFCQLLLIWYANIPEETQYFIKRMKDNDGGWNCIFYLDVIWNFGIPFLLLLPQPVKRNIKLLFWISIWILVGRWIDLWFCILPTTQEHWWDLDISGGTIFAFVGLFGLVVFKALGRAPMLPKKDPFLDESLHYKQ